MRYLIDFWQAVAPEDKDVTAGGIAFAVFAFLILMVVLLAWSFNKHLKIAKTNQSLEQKITESPDE